MAARVAMRRRMSERRRSVAVAPAELDEEMFRKPKPPAGFVVDNQGKVLAVASRRIVTMVDETNNLPLDCVVRRVFQSSTEEDCLLLCPVDTPVHIMRSSDFTAWSDVDDDEFKALIPSIAYALAKVHMHFVDSGFCYTARGCFRYSEEDVIDFAADDAAADEDIEGLPSEGVKITFFNLDGTHYMIYAPSDPVLFVAIKDRNGVLRIADDDILDDPAAVRAVIEETDFNAFVEEEAAFLESMLGESQE